MGPGLIQSLGVDGSTLVHVFDPTLYSLYQFVRGRPRLNARFCPGFKIKIVALRLMLSTRFHLV